MQRIYDYFRPFSYHDYTPPVDSTEECVICHDPLSEGSNPVAHNDLNPRIEARQEHLHPVHKECLEQWIQEPSSQVASLKDRVLCPTCKNGIDFRSFFPELINVNPLKNLWRNTVLLTSTMTAGTLISASLLASSGLIAGTTRESYSTMYQWISDSMVGTVMVIVSLQLFSNRPITSYFRLNHICPIVSIWTALSVTAVVLQAAQEVDS